MMKEAAEGGRFRMLTRRIGTSLEWIAARPIVALTFMAVAYLLIIGAFALLGQSDPRDRWYGFLPAWEGYGVVWAYVRWRNGRMMRGGLGG